MDENNQNGTGPWWKPAVELVAQVSTWVVAPIVLALIFGKMLDTRYGTKPIIFLALAGLGFLVTCFGIVRVIRRYIKEIKNLTEKENKND